MKSKFTHEPVDYCRTRQNRPQERNYLLLGSIKKVNGGSFNGRSVTRRRIFLTLIAAVIIIIGLWYVIN